MIIHSYLPREETITRLRAGERGRYLASVTCRRAGISRENTEMHPQPRIGDTNGAMGLEGAKIEREWLLSLATISCDSDATKGCRFLVTAFDSLQAVLSRSADIEQRGSAEVVPGSRPTVVIAARKSRRSVVVPLCAVESMHRRVLRQTRCRSLNSAGLMARFEKPGLVFRFRHSCSGKSLASINSERRTILIAQRHPRPSARSSELFSAAIADIRHDR